MNRVRYQDQLIVFLAMPILLTLEQHLLLVNVRSS